MPNTDREQLVREAITTIMNADTALRTVCGRTIKLCIERHAFSIESLVPVAVVDVAEVDMGSGSITCTIDGIARGTAAGETAREVCEAAVAALSYLNFEGQSLPIVPSAEIRESVAPDDGFNAINLTGDPTLHQARATLPLLYME